MDGSGFVGDVEKECGGLDLTEKRLVAVREESAEENIRGSDRRDVKEDAHLVVRSERLGEGSEAGEVQQVVATRGRIGVVGRTEQRELKREVESAGGVDGGGRENARADSRLDGAGSRYGACNAVA